MRATRAFVVGIGAAYFFDPRLGRRRRAVARDRSATLVRGLTRSTRSKARYAEGRAQGVYARTRHTLLGRPVESGDAVRRAAHSKRGVQRRGQ